MGDADLIESGGPDGRQPGDGRRTGDDKRRSIEADGDHFGAELSHRAGALHIPQWGTKDG